MLSNQHTWSLYCLVRLEHAFTPTADLPPLSTYVGVTQHLHQRVHEHQTGKCHTTRGRSWVLRAYVSSLTKAQAFALEQWFKRGSTITRRRALIVLACDIHTPEVLCPLLPAALAVRLEIGSSNSAPAPRTTFSATRTNSKPTAAACCGTTPSDYDMP